MKTQWGGNSLTYLVHTIQHQYLHWLETAVQCCVPEAVFWAEEDFGFSVRTSHHYLVQFGVPQATDHTLRRAGENSITQEETTLTDTTDGNTVKRLEGMVIWALACYSSCFITGAQFSMSSVQQSTSPVPKPRPAASTEKPGNEASAINKVREISFLWGSLYNPSVIYMAM